jgi:hypothetical protein
MGIVPEPPGDPRGVGQGGLPHSETIGLEA